MKSAKIFFLISLAFIFSCSKENLVELSFTDLYPFNKIILNSSFDVYLNEDTNYCIKIKGDEDIIGNVAFNITDNVLTIRNKSNSKWLTPTKNKIGIYISSKPLSAIDANETCNIKTLNPITSDEFFLILRSKENEATLELDCHSFLYWNNTPCGGKLTLSGKTDELSMMNFAIMSVDARNLIAQNAFVENSSKGNCEVTVVNKFEYSIKGIGNIDLYGSPKEIIKLQVTSTGQLILH